MTPRDLVRTHGGDATALGANVPRPGSHSPKDRRLRIVPSRTASLGFIVLTPLQRPAQLSERQRAVAERIIDEVRREPSPGLSRTGTSVRKAPRLSRHW
jgi:hypothetical protein